MRAACTCTYVHVYVSIVLLGGGGGVLTNFIVLRSFRHELNDSMYITCTCTGVGHKAAGQVVAWSGVGPREVLHARLEAPHHCPGPRRRPPG